MVPEKEDWVSWTPFFAIACGPKRRRSTMRLCYEELPPWLPPPDIIVAFMDFSGLVAPAVVSLAPLVD